MSLESEQQDYEERLRYRLKILSEQLKADKVKIASHLAEGFEESFRNIKYDESGEIILESVDGRIRSMALAIEHFDTREKLKKEIVKLSQSAKKTATWAEKIENSKIKIKNMDGNHKETFIDIKLTMENT